MEDSNDVKYNLTGKKIIPLNAPIGFANTTPPTTLPFQAVEKGQSVSEGLCAGQGIPYYEDPTSPDILKEIESLLSDTTNQDNESSVKINKLANILKSMLTQPVVNPNAVPTTLKMMLDMYSTISQPVALLSMGAIPEWSQSVRDNNGGYAKGSIIREREGDISWVYYQSLIDNNMNDKPRLASHEGWGIIFSYQYDNDLEAMIFKYFGRQGVATLDHQGMNVFGLDNNVLSLKASYSSDGAKAPYFQDAKSKIGSSNNSNPEYTYLGDGSVIIQGIVTSVNGKFSVTLPNFVQPNVDGRFPPVFGNVIVNQQIDPTLMQPVQIDIYLANVNTILGSICKFVNGSPIPLNIDVGFFLKAKLV
jgi:hypothetical protein